MIIACSIRKAASARRHSRCVCRRRARQGRRVTLIDADPQGSALDWSEQRRVKGFRFLPRRRHRTRTLHREAPSIARRVDHVVIYASRLASLMRSALLASDLALLPVQPSPFDGWASAETLALIDEARSSPPTVSRASCLTTALRAQ